MRVIAWDTETALIRPAQQVPTLVCLTWQERGTASPSIVDAAHAEPILRAWLKDPDVQLVGHNVAYDMAVIAEAFPALRPLVFAAYETNRVTCTMLRQMLLDIASGVYRGRHVGKGIFIKLTYHLEDLAERCAGFELKKDAWRLSYCYFIDVPLAQWPARAAEVQAHARVRVGDLMQRLETEPDNKTLAKEVEGLQEMIAGPTARVTDYPLDDARATLLVWEAQERHAGWLADQYRQAYAAFALNLSSAWGLRTDEVGVEVLRAEVTEQLVEVEEDLREAEIVRPNGTRDTKAAKRRMIDVCKRDGITLRRTDGHATEGKCKKLDGTKVPDGADECEEHVCLDDDACTATEDPILILYAELSTLKKVLGNDVEALAKGIAYPIHTRYGLAETGRTTSSKPNIQNWVRARKCKRCEGKGELPAVVA